VKNNIVSGCQSALEFVAGGQRHSLELVPWHQPAVAVGMPLLKTRIGKELIYLTLSRWPDTGLELKMPSLNLVQSMPRALRVIVAEAGLGDFIPVLEARFNDKVTIVDLTQATKTIMYEDSLQMILDRAGDLVIVGLFSSKGFMDRLLEKLGEWPGPLPAFSNRLGFHANLVVGCSHITQSDLRGLSCGDVVLLEPTDFLERRLIQMRFSPNLEIYIKLEQGKAMVESIKQNNNSEAQHAEPVSIDELNVELTFDVGGQQLPLRELKKLRKGYTFELNQPLNQLVTIRCNGQKIGVAELIEVDDRVGMRVVEIIGNSHP
jgi:type III secretion protein Q